MYGSHNVKKLGMGDIFIVDKETGERKFFGKTTEVELIQNPSNEDTSKLQELIDKRERELYKELLLGGKEYTCTVNLPIKSIGISEFYNHAIKQLTLQATNGEFDTIFVPNSQIRHELTERFGELNYVVNHNIENIVFWNSGDYDE